MRELQKKQQTRRRFYSIPSLIMLTLVTIVLIRGTVRVIIKERESLERLNNLEEELITLTLREQKLQENIQDLKTEEGIKDEIRERFSVIQEGEQVAVIVDERNKASSTRTLTLPWYKRLWLVIMREK